MHESAKHMLPSNAPKGSNHIVDKVLRTPWMMKPRLWYQNYIGHLQELAEGHWDSAYQSAVYQETIGASSTLSLIDSCQRHGALAMSASTILPSRLLARLLRPYDMTMHSQHKFYVRAMHDMVWNLCWNMEWLLMRRICCHGQILIRHEPRQKGAANTIYAGTNLEQPQ